ncbi:ABC transporter permease [Cumulibacter manganitolerans]|uniref:ABC transporter permease n=1 Tax=Cumulibacter manganitolerans TaxID=1884992 RepID=UPI001297D14D|nr:ABC transporter permease [Cumulibacter manganitolerans]
MWRFLRSDLRAFVAAAFLAALVALMLLAPFISTGHPDLQGPDAFAGIGQAGHLLGADDTGRDSWTRLLYGARTSILASMTAVVTALVVGVPLGLAAGYFGRWVDAVLMRVVDTLLAFPSLVLAIGVGAALGGGITKAMIAVGVVFSPIIARITRGQVLSLRRRLFVEVAATYGSSRLRILLRHVLPNSLRPVVIQSALLFATGILAEASLSFLGLGVRPPTASWGTMLRSSFDYLSSAPYAIYAPGIAIVLTVLAVNSLIDALADRWEGIAVTKRRRNRTMVGV